MQDLLDQHDYILPKVGDIRQGIIVSITSQGIIVDLGLKRDGMVTTTDLGKLDAEEREGLKIDDEIFVYVLNTDKPDSLIVSIHLAKMNQDWINAEELMANKEMFEAEIIGYNKGGVIVPFGLLRGFIPLSHLQDFSFGMGERKKQQRLAKLRGEKLPMKVIEVDRRRRRLVFSQREALKEWNAQRRAELLEKISQGDIIKGRVSGLRDFGAFVDLGGADGLVHISELAWHRVNHPREVLKVGDEIDVYVMRIDNEKQRISLSRKKVVDNPWHSVETRYELNQLIEGTITRIVDYGAFAEVEPGIEGLLHISQLSRSTVDKVSEVIQEGEKHLLRIVSIDSKRQRMGLSLRAVTTMEQIEWMAEKEIEKARIEAESETPEVAKEEVEVVDQEAVKEMETAVSDSTPAPAEVNASDEGTSSEEE